MTLFDAIPRVLLRPRFDSESEFEYDNISARPGVTAWRDVAEEWFAAYPDEHKRDLRARFRSPASSDHYGAFFELYLHELLRVTGHKIEIHPHLETCTNRTDFLATTSNGRMFYVEAVLAHCLSKKAEAAGRRMAQVYDCLNQMHSPNFFVSVHVKGSPASSPPGTRLRRALEEWLATLNPDEIADLFKSGERVKVPRFPWSHDGWEIEFEPLPKSTENRGRPGVRPIGIRAPEVRWMDSASEIRGAVKSKAKKYGRLDRPLVVCVNVLDWIDRDDVLNALLGDEQTVVSFSGDTVVGQEERRALNGVFGYEGQPHTRRVSAVVVARDLVPFTMGSVDPELFQHPWPYNKLDEDIWPTAQWVVNHEERRLVPKAGTPAHEILRLPHPWPVSLE